MENVPPPSSSKKKILFWGLGLLALAVAAYVLYKRRPVSALPSGDMEEMKQRLLSLEQAQELCAKEQLTFSSLRGKVYRLEDEVSHLKQAKPEPFRPSLETPFKPKLFTAKKETKEPEETTVDIPVEKDEEVPIEKEKDL